ncbi:MAG: hypothetical protein EPO08_15085 [Rhodospirillaceae bacterium]|nr:MAG: hypothetical protein EPO08_15085 [Rhodospirillaceae bacterium]
MAIRVLFAAGDVGGARALIPIIHLAQQQGLETMVLRHGHLAIEGSPEWRWIASEGDIDALHAALMVARPDVVVFASSVKDPTALAIARLAQRRQIPTVHVLDSWTMYRQRMTTDGLHMFVPTIYTAIDDLAADGAAAEGIPKSILRITGQPALVTASWRTTADQTPIHKSAHKNIDLLFVSEPAAADHGESSQSLQYRGYTEASVLSLLCSALQPLSDGIFVSVLPHPRENASDIENVWNTQKGSLLGTVLRQNALGDKLAQFDGIIGMASVLLYQAWLAGRPVLSIQPELRIAALRQIEHRDGATLVDNSVGAREKIRAWVAGLTPGQMPKPRPELTLHARSAEFILSLARALTEAEPLKADHHDR